MLKTLRSRLFASYLLLIVALFVIVTGALIATSSLRRVRSFQTAVELNAIARPVLVDIGRANNGRVSNAEFARSVEEIADEADIRILWVDRNEYEIIHDSEKEWHGQKIPSDTAPRNSLSLEDSTHFFEDTDGKRWVFYVPPNGEMTRSYLVFVQQEPETGEFFNSLFGPSLRRSLMVSLALSFILTGLIARSIARPLQRISQAADEIADGNYEQSLPLEGPAEVRHLASNFNRMAQQVKATQQAQRDFVANVSHDLKTPITSIQGWSQALLDGTADGEIVQASAEIIHTEAERMSRMVHQLLELERLEAGKMELKKESFSVRDWLEGVVAPFMPRASEKDISVDIAASSVDNYLGDVDKLARAVGNLVDNAIRHTPSGGSVRVSAEKSFSGLTIKVADTGVGIADAEKQRIFERFYQSDRARTSSRTGTGIGLAITREITEAHGGSVTVGDNSPKGTVFTIQLPRV